MLSLSQVHDFWLASIQCLCILGLDILKAVRAVLDLRKDTLGLEMGQVKLAAVASSRCKHQWMDLQGPWAAHTSSTLASSDNTMDGICQGTLLPYAYNVLGQETPCTKGTVTKGMGVLTDEELAPCCTCAGWDGGQPGTVLS
ncbi:hypothetical protein AOLI_G00099630 [Acnodon oligacanthus]